MSRQELWNVAPSAAQISQWLHDARKRAGLTRRAVSVRIDVTERSIQRWEAPTQEVLPPADQFFGLVEVYGAAGRLSELLDGAASELPAGARQVAKGRPASDKKQRGAR